MGEIHLGDKIVKYEDHSLAKYAERMHHSMTHEERRDLFHEAKHGSDRAAYFQPKPGVHLVLRHDPSGHYTLEKG
ncbi:MAG: hypothetical protein AAB871_01810 [Patescibacteria group bacterium]